MANLPEVAQWEPGIYQIEETDPVQGGPNGIDNLPNKQLANRTAYLKEQVESLGTRVTNVENAVAGLNIPSVHALEEKQAAAALWAARHAAYSAEHGYLELIYPGYTLADNASVRVISGVAGDDSLDVEDTTLLAPGRSYSLSQGTTTETVTILSILSATRVRLTAVLANNYDSQAILRRSSAAIDYSAHTISGPGVYYSLPFAFQGTGKVIIRQLAGNEPSVEVSPANTEVYSGLTLLSSTTNGGITERVFALDAEGDVNLRVTLAAGDILEGIAIFQDAQVVGFAAGVQIDAVYADPAGSPTQADVGGIPVVSFAADKNQSVSFSRLWGAHLDVAIELGYFMSVDSAGDVKIRISYAVNGGVFTDMDQIITPGAGTGYRRVTLNSKIPGSAFPIGDNLLTVKVSRLGTDAADTHTGAFQLASLRLL